MTDDRKKHFKIWHIFGIRKLLYRFLVSHFTLLLYFSPYNEKTNVWIIEFQKKIWQLFWRVLLGHFIKPKPLISESTSSGISWMSFPRRTMPIIFEPRRFARPRRDWFFAQNWRIGRSTVTRGFTKWLVLTFRVFLNDL